MRRFFGAVVGAMVFASVAQAQTPVDVGQGYLEGVAQSAFGNVTSQSYGLEFGYTVGSNVQIFVEAGHTLDVTTAELSSGARLMADALSQTQNGVSYAVKEPVTFGAGGAKYLFSTGSRLVPYALAGVGVAHVQHDVTFSVAGTDVTNNMAQYGIVLGSDLSGSFTKPMLLIGFGAAYPVWRQMILDFQYRYSRIFAPDQGINVNRAGIGVGFKF